MTDDKRSVAQEIIVEMAKRNPRSPSSLSESIGYEQSKVEAGLDRLRELGLVEELENGDEYRIDKEVRSSFN